MKVCRIGFTAVPSFWLALLVLIGTAQAQTWLQVEADGSDDAGKPAGSGTYFYQLDAAESDYRKLLILR